MATEDIAVDLKIPIAKVRERIENYKSFKEYIEKTGEDNPRRFAFFAECPRRFVIGIGTTKKTRRHSLN